MSLKSLNARLTFIFSLVFVCFTAALFAATYQLLASSLVREDNARFQQTVLRFWALYSIHGDDLLSEDLFRSEFLDDNQALIRIADENDDTILFYFPEHFTMFDLNRLDDIGRDFARSQNAPDDQLRSVLQDMQGSRFLEILTLRLPENRIFQAGMEVTNRIMVLRRFGVLFPIIVLPFLLLSVIGGLLFSRSTLRPIRSLISTTRSIIETGKLDRRISERSTGDELEELVKLFNRMMEKLESLVNGMRNALDNVAHDLRTPITRLRARAEAAIESEESADRGPDDHNSAASVAALRECLDEAGRMQSMLAILMDISEAETGYMKLDLRSVDLSAVLTDMSELYGYAAQDRGLRIERDIQDGLSVIADESRIRQVLANLLDNALKYTPSPGVITVSAAREPAVPGAAQSVRLDVSDTGMGIPAGEQPLIWNRLYRCDRSRSEQGLGLGLSLVKAVTEAHGGSVAVESEVDRGSRFTILLPVAGTEAGTRAGSDRISGT